MVRPMKPILLMDFGSTYTKLTAVDPDAAAILGTAQSYTTVESDVGEGLMNAQTELERITGKLDYQERYACSSAAGGLRMIASGLVPSLTAEAAKRAALGAGAKVIRTYAYQLTEDDLGEIDALRPDMLLLTGGTDGGNRECIESNAAAIAQIRHRCPVVIAGNRASAKCCQRALASAGFEAIVTENVMPRFEQLNIDPCRAAIRDLFLSRIVAAKGLTRAQALIDGILMPTPAAVLSALQILSEHVGELMACDLGGATTDVFSITEGLPTRAGTVVKGLPEPYAKRTVEGDIGMRYSAHGVAEAVGIHRLAQTANQTAERMQSWLDRIDRHKDILPETCAEKDCDCALAEAAIELGLTRHAGTIQQVFTPMGVAYEQVGKDLTRTKLLILTGGALIRSGKALEIAKAAMAAEGYPQSLMPRSAQVAVDRHYILSAMGVLAQRHPVLSKNIMIKEFA